MIFLKERNGFFVFPYFKSDKLQFFQSVSDVSGIMAFVFIKYGLCDCLLRQLTSHHTVI
jgi:hypothetical protein